MVRKILIGGIAAFIGLAALSAALSGGQTKTKTVVETHGPLPSRLRPRSSPRPEWSKLRRR
jgi:hypothetical protein